MVGEMCSWRHQRAGLVLTASGIVGAVWALSAAMTAPPVTTMWVCELVKGGWGGRVRAYALKVPSNGLRGEDV